MIEKLDVYGFKKGALCLILNYLNNRKQRAKINSSFSTFQNIISEAPQGSLLGHLLFNIFLTDKLKAMLMITHYTQQEIFLKKLRKK